MARFPSMPLFTDALLADCGHLSDDEFGLYMRVLIAMWRAPAGKIPAKAYWLEKKFRKPIAEIGPILAEFCECDGNFYTQGRLQDELAWVEKNSKRQSVRSKSRWNKKKQASVTDADMQASGNAPIPHPTPPISETSVSDIPSPQFSEFGGEYEFESTLHNPDSLFHIFWGAYPEISTKGNKKEARAKFMELIKKGEDHVRIIEGARRYAAHCGSEGQFNQHASTFLTRAKRRWEGEWAPGRGNTSALEVLAEGFRQAGGNGGDEG